MSTTATSTVKAVRLALGLTQEEMAQKLGCSLSSARRFEQEGVLPRVKAVRGNLLRMAKQAGIELEAK